MNIEETINIFIDEVKNDKEILFNYVLLVILVLGFTVLGIIVYMNCRHVMQQQQQQQEINRQEEVQYENPMIRALEEV